MTSAKDFVFPIIRRIFPSQSMPGREPLRKNIDYQSVGRKTFIVLDEEIPCFACDYMTIEGAKLGCSECIVRQIMDS